MASSSRLRPRSQGPGGGGIEGDGGPGPSPALLWLALGSVYVIWGSTYLAIRVAVRTLPPLLMASVRFLVAGVVLYALTIRRGDRTGDRPGWRQWRDAAIVGGLLLLGGNGLVVLAEKRVISSVAALLIATIPLWMVLIGRVALKERVSWREYSGLALGLAGLALLVGIPGHGGVDPGGALMLVLASLLWAAGSMYSKRASLPSRPLVATAMEMMAGGVLLAVVGIASGELADFHPAQVSASSVAGLAYLVVFGSWIAFSAYVWLLRVARTSLVATYPFVNPVVAVFLGWAILSEAITGRTLVAGVVIVLAVALIISAQSKRALRSHPLEDPSPPLPADANTAVVAPGIRGEAAGAENEG